AGDRGADRAVDRGLTAASDPADHITDRRRTAEGRGVAFDQTELAKTVKQVSADLLAEVRADRIVGPGQRLGRRETAVNRDVPGRSRPRLKRCERAQREKREENFGSHSHGDGYLSGATLELCET